MSELTVVYPQVGQSIWKSMGEMASHLEGKRVIVISDNDLLFKAIERNLRARLGMQVYRSAGDAPGWVQRQAHRDGWELIIVALSEPVGEPVVELVRASLARWLGRVPLLIISERPFDARPEENIFHLDFPFDLDQLYAMVERMLGEEDSSVTVGYLI